jgi:hypothetical protein
MVKVDKTAEVNEVHITIIQASRLQQQFKLFETVLHQFEIN